MHSSPAWELFALPAAIVVNKLDFKAHLCSFFFKLTPVDHGHNGNRHVHSS